MGLISKVDVMPHMVIGYASHCWQESDLLVTRRLTIDQERIGDGPPPLRRTYDLDSARFHAMFSCRIAPDES